jgi:glucose-6-phosphate 1-dehydrogenase
MVNRGVEPHLFVILGATGDLTRRKLLPALYRLVTRGHLPQVRILGVARTRDLNDEGFRKQALEALETAGFSVNDAALGWCNDCLFYHSTGGGEPADYQALVDRISMLERKHDLPGNRVFYLALPPAAFPTAITGLGEAGLYQSSGWARLVVEKPFGHDLTSAQELNRVIHRFLKETQVFRIDHYLGKETVQNLLVFRFANAMFESVWNRDRIERVEITVAESLGLEGRAGYYETAGALRDMVQNHLTQLLTLTAMEIPSRFEAESIRNEKVKVLQSLVPLRWEDVTFGQYTGSRIDGQRIPGYHEEPGVDPDSQTETYAALRLEISHWRWQGVPFYLRTGKRLPHKSTEIAIAFRCPPVSIFQPFAPCSIQSNALVITIQPDESFELSFQVKSPGEPFRVETQRLRFRYADVHGPLPEAYETLLLDVAKGDPTLFVRADEVEAAWRFYAPILEQRPKAHPYPAGSWGPPEAEQLVRGEEKQWVTN